MVHVLRLVNALSQLHVRQLVVINHGLVMLTVMILIIFQNVVMTMVIVALENVLLVKQKVVLTIQRVVTLQ
jgi:hypothetical protein